MATDIPDTLLGHSANVQQTVIILLVLTHLSMV